MKFKIVAVGKLKEEYLRQAVGEYVKRISRFADVEIIEIDEYCVKGAPNAAQIEQIKRREGEAILAKSDGYVIAADIDGKMLNSVQLAQLVAEQKQYNSVFTFVIGGSYGLSDQVKSRADVRLSFGKMTMPHQLFRAVLCEQIYRVCCLNNNIAYHK